MAVKITHTYPADDDPIFGPTFVVTTPIKSSTDTPAPKPDKPKRPAKERP